jgi:hypothetical protein
MSKLDLRNFTKPAAGAEAPVTAPVTTPPAAAAKPKKKAKPSFGGGGLKAALANKGMV